MIYVLKKLIYSVKRVVMAAMIIYTYDSFSVLKHTVPINYVTLSFVSIFGVVAMFYLICFSFWF